MSFRYRLLTSGLIIGLFILVGSLGTGLAGMETPLLESYNRSNLIRLHIIANSDSPADQTVKLLVRDKILQCSESLLLKVEDPAQAAAIISQNIPLLAKAARAVLKQNSQAMPVRIFMGRFNFPERVYPFGVLPAGEYQGLRVVLGKGEGRNWWCVLYPPLCLLDKEAPSFKGIKGDQHPKIEYHLAALEKLVKEKGLTMDEFWKGWGRFFGLI